MTMRHLWMRVRALVFRARVEQELDDEITFHLEQEARRLVATGLAPAEARRRAVVAFGGVERVKETYRDGRGDRWWHDVSTDVRQGVRALVRRPTFTTTVVATLALGIGANVAIFSAVHAVVLRPLPYREPDRLVALWEDNDAKQWRGQVAAPANMFDWEAQVPAFDGVAAWSDFENSAILTGQGEAVALRSATVTGNFFHVLGVPAARGRTLEPAETWETPQRVAVLSDRAWRERFGGDPSVVGRTVTLDGRAVEVVGVMGPMVGLPHRDVDVWLPLRLDPADRGQTWFRRAHWLRPVARLRSGVTEEEARTQLTTVMASLEQRYPDTNTGMRAGLGDLQGFLLGSVKRPLLLLQGATLFLLLIACANVGTLLLVRAVTREHDVVMRRALGAGSARIARHALVESAILAVVGGGVGLVLGWWGTRLLAALQPGGLLPVESVRPDATVVLATLALSAVVALVIGTVPAIWSARRSPTHVIRDAARGTTTGRRSRRWITGLAVAEVGLAATLTVVGGLLVRSYRALSAVDPGFDPRGVSAATVVLPRARYGTPEAQVQFHAQVIERARAIPGVESAALTTVLPLTGDGYTSDFVIRGRSDDGVGREVRHRAVSSGYFATMKVPVLAGRAFGPEDVASGEPVVLINRTFAERYFAGRDPIGAWITQDLVPDSSSIWRRVIGVVGNERGRSLGVAPGLDMIEPLTQDPSPAIKVLVRSTVPPSTVLRSLERAILSLDPALAPTAMTTMDGLRDQALAMDRFLAVLITSLALAGALVAIVGVYGVVAQAALRRVPELGIRLALGADEGSIRWLVIRHGIALTSGGALLGLVGAFAASSAVRDTLFGVSPHDPVTHAIVATALVMVGAAAAAVPAWRLGRRGRLASVFR